MAKTSLWLVQGSADTVNPASSVETIHQSILDAGGTQVKFTEYQGLVHVQSIMHARTERCLLDWLLAQLHDGVVRPGEVTCDTLDAGTAARVTVTLDVPNIDAAYEGKPVTIKLFSECARRRECRYACKSSGRVFRSTKAEKRSPKRECSQRGPRISLMFVQYVFEEWDCLRRVTRKACYVGCQHEILHASANDGGRCLHERKRL